MKHVSWASALALLVYCATSAQAQAPLRKQGVENTQQAIDRSDTTICARGGSLTTDDMFECGKESYVASNDLVALKWWQRAANKGNSRAQFWLGKMYEGGDGVPQDYVQAYKWYDIAAATVGIEAERLPATANPSTALDNQYEIDARDNVAKGMTPSQISAAQKLAREWKPGM
jgi:TPR repeat protein